MSSIPTAMWWHLVSDKSYKSEPVLCGVVPRHVPSLVRQIGNEENEKKNLPHLPPLEGATRNENESVVWKP